MQTGNFLGIYLAKDHAAVVCIAVNGNASTVAGCFSVPQQGVSEEAGGFDALIQRIIAAGLAERQWKFTETAVALDCSMFMQHAVRSEFTDVRKITQTVRFDTEETLGSDATDVAIAFKIDSAEQSGANLSVFTTQKQLFGSLITALAANNLDPVSIEPDVNCLARFVCQKVAIAADAHPLFAFLSGRTGYFLAPLTLPWQRVSPTPPAAMRTFLIGAGQNRTELLTRQVSQTRALLAGAQPVNRLEVCDAENLVNAAQISDELSLPTKQIDIAASAQLTGEAVVACPNLVEFAVAYGAALSFLDPPTSTNWRSDFMPYQGRKQRLQSTLKYFSFAATLLMLALGLYGFMQGVAFNGYRVRLREKFAADYSKAMFGQAMPKLSRDAVRRVKIALARIKDAQKGAVTLTGQDVIAAKLSLVLDAFNKCAHETSLHVESVSVTDKSITISGSTSSSDNTLKVFDALRRANLDILQQRVAYEQGRSTFNVTAEPKR